MISNKIRSIISLTFSSALFAAVLLAGIPSQVSAAGDHRDLSFSGNGKLATDFGGVDDYARDVAIQADGKIVVVGSSGSGSAAKFALARYNPNGSLDTTFNGTGKLTTTVNGGGSGARAVVILPNGKIVVGGYARSQSSGSTEFALARYNANGSLDSTFDGNGTVQTAFTFDLGSSAGAEILSLAVQPDGKIVAVGAVNGLYRASAASDWAIARYNTDGSLDNTFSADGKTTLDFETDSGEFTETASSVAILPSGKILVGGTSLFQNTNFALARFNEDGSLDITFNNNGKVITDFGGIDILKNLKVQPDGKIVVGGTSAISGIIKFALARYNAEGMPDASFSDDGKVVLDFNGTLQSIALQSDGKIVAVGTANSDFMLTRVNPNGSLDTAFGLAGIVSTDIFSNSPDTAAAVAVQPDGKIVVAGYAQNTGSTFDFAVARYLRNSVKILFDFDGDGKADVSVFRPSNGAWYLQQSTAGFTGVGFGQNGDKITPADYDGDGKTDVAVFRAGIWYLIRSQLGFTGIAFGAATDIPVPADFDGDGRAEICVYRPSNGGWYYYNFVTNQTGGIQFGLSEDKPVPADYDDDGRADVAVFRPSVGTWYLQRSNLGFTGIQFGVGTDKPMPADYDGDGRADVAVFRSSNGTWYLNQSTAGFTGIQFGASTDTPTPADYDGDGKADVAVYRSSVGTWYLNRSTAGFTGVAFGSAADIPVPAAYVP